MTDAALIHPDSVTSCPGLVPRLPSPTRVVSATPCSAPPSPAALVEGRVPSALVIPGGERIRGEVADLQQCKVAHEVFIGHPGMGVQIARLAHSTDAKPPGPDYGGTRAPPLQGTQHRGDCRSPGGVPVGSLKRLQATLTRTPHLPSCAAAVAERPCSPLPTPWLCGEKTAMGRTGRTVLQNLKAVLGTRARPP